MLSDAVTNELIAVVSRERYLDAPETLTCYAYDSYLEESMPDAVVLPITTEEVAAVVKIAAVHRIPVTARGAGTSICGGPVPARHGIVLCLSRMNGIVELNPRDRYVVVQPGIINGDLQKALAPHGFFYPPDPGSMAFSTIGGNVAVNAGGPRCLKYGVTADYVLGMQVVLPSGEVIRFGSCNVKDVTGYKLGSLFCGSEGTLGIITEITLRVAPSPESFRTILVTFDNLEATAEAVADIIGSGIIPASMELMDNVGLNMIENALHLGLPTEAAGTLLIEVDGVHESCDREMTTIIEKVRNHGALEIETADTEEDRNRLWTARRAAYGIFARMAPDILSEDVTVPVTRIPEMAKIINETIAKYRLRGGMIAHAGDGNMHPFICADKKDPEEWGRVEAAYDEIFAAAVALKGTLSGEHGIGLAKTKYLPLVMDETTRAFMGRLKQAIDPDGILNPGKFV